MDWGSQSGADKVCGVDEAGRGALAGPVVSACVMLDVSLKPFLFKDSKVLSEKKREELYFLLKESNSVISISVISAEYIDSTNILKATLEGMKQSIEQLPIKPNKVLIDGNRAPYMPDYRIETIVKGDKLEPSISAASIVAKVTRDRLMVELHQKYPEYGFLENKGYGTKRHYMSLRKYGSSDIHRRSFNLSRQECLW